MRVFAPLAAVLLAGCTIVGVSPAVTPSEPATATLPAQSPTPIVTRVTPEPVTTTESTTQPIWTAKPIILDPETPSATPAQATDQPSPTSAAATADPSQTPPEGDSAASAAIVSCEAVDLDDVRTALDSAEVIGPKWYEDQKGDTWAEECRWYSGNRAKVMSVVVFLVGGRDWGATKKGAKAHASFVGISLSDYANAAGKTFYWVTDTAQMSGHMSSAHALLVTPRNEQDRRDEIHSATNSVISDLLDSAL